MASDFLSPTHRRVDDRYIKWCHQENLNREQTAFVDMYWARGSISNGGLHGFWENLSSEAKRMIVSFQIGGEKRLADLIEASRFLIDAPLDEEGYYLLSDDQEKIVDEAEDTIFDDAFIDRLAAFMDGIVEN